MQQTDSKKELEDLPESENEFWDGEVHRTEVKEPAVKFFDQPHYFERVAGHQGYCEHCDYGFELDPGDRIENGHLYNKKGKLII